MSILTSVEVKKGFLELSLIFVGITLALGFENWNADRERQSQEAKLLSELLLDIQETQRDVRTDIDSHNDQLRITEEIIQHLNTETTEEESTVGAFSKFPGICIGTALFPKTSSYESIKTIGLDLIENDELRSSIASLFELSLPRIREFEERVEKIGYEECLPYFLDNFKLTSALVISERSRVTSMNLPAPRATGGDPEPTNLTNTLNDSKIRMIVRSMFNERAILIALYEDLDSRASELEIALEAELAN